jgi:hypothetical protein
MLCIGYAKSVPDEGFRPIDRPQPLTRREFASAHSRHPLPQGERERKAGAAARPPPRLTETSIEPVPPSQRLTTGGDTISMRRACRTSSGLADDARKTLRERNHACLRSETRIAWLAVAIERMPATIWAVVKCVMFFVRPMGRSLNPRSFSKRSATSSNAHSERSVFLLSSVSKDASRLASISAPPKKARHPHALAWDAGW